MLRVSMALACSALLVSSIPAAAADSPKTVTFTKDVAPIFQQKCESCHRPDNMAPMSLADLRRGASVGEVDRRARRRAADAAVAHRQDGRHPEVQERSLAERRADRDDRGSGSPPARRRAIRRTCRRPKVWTDDIGLAARRRSTARRISIVKSPEYTMPAGRAGRVVAADRADRAHRTALGARDRHPPRRQERAQDHASRARAPASSRKTWTPRSSPTIRTSPATASSWNGRSARTATRCVPTRAV